jgi:FAD/FMN-containing dehydrogenase
LIIAWGGAVARVPEDASPLGGREAAFIVHPFIVWNDPAEDERMIALGRAYREDLATYATGATYLNFVGDEGDQRVRAAFAPGGYERLARLKAKWDPKNVFHGNQNVRPFAPVG